MLPTHVPDSKERVEIGDLIILTQLILKKMKQSFISIR